MAKAAVGLGLLSVWIQGWESSAFLFRPSQVGKVAEVHGSCVAPASTTQIPRSKALAMQVGGLAEPRLRDDKFIPRPARDSLVEEFPQLKEHPDYVASIGSTGEQLSEEEQRRRLEVARAFVKMDAIILLNRGHTTIAEDFTYYSPYTGSLNKDQFLLLLKSMDRALEDYKRFPSEFKVYQDGVVSYLATIRAKHEGPFKVGDKTIAPTNVQIISDKDLCTINFNENGLLTRFTEGLYVRESGAVADPLILDEIELLKKKIKNQQDKLKTLVGMEHTIAYQKGFEDVQQMSTQQFNLERKCEVDSNTGGKGGIPGIFNAIGAELPADPLTLLSPPRTEAYVPQAVRNYGYSVPAEIKNYKNVKWQEDSFRGKKNSNVGASK